MGVSHRRRHRLAVPPRSVIGSLSQEKIGSMESRLPSSAKGYGYGYTEATECHVHEEHALSECS